MTVRTYGVLLRVYTPKTEEVTDRVERALRSVRQILEVNPVLQRTILLVPRDYDCGQTQQALSKRISVEGLKDFVKVRAPHGHHSCEVLNDGLMELRGVSHALIISGKAVSYLTPAAMLAIDQVFEKGAKVAGLAIDELRDIVLAGRIQNTFAAWDVDALLGVGGFDSKTCVEEITPLVRLARAFGPCIAPIDFDGVKLDIHTSETARKSHREVMMNKLARQHAECMRVGSDFQFIQDAVMT